MQNKTIKLAVFGDPIAHSLSPTIHQLFGQECGVELEYTKIRAPEISFQEQFLSFVQAGGVGANVTLPLKTKALELAEFIDDYAQEADAANTLYMKEGRWHATNTDGLGLLADFQRQHVQLQQANVLLIGAGGAAKGVLPVLLQAGVAKLVIANRTVTKAEQLIQRHRTYCQQTEVKLLACGLTDIPDYDYDVIIQATSMTLHKEKLDLPAYVFHQQPFCYDMLYGQPLPFLELAKQHLCSVSDGLGMLVGQAAVSFSYWTGKKPAIDPVIELMRVQLDKGTT